MMILFIIIMILYAIIGYIHPWIDNFSDYRGEKHIILWYTNFKGERKFINITGSQQ